MKRICILATITLLTSLMLHAQALEELEKKIAADNHIQTKTQFDYNYIAGKPEANGLKTIQTKYDHNGDIVQKSTYTNKGAESGSEIYEYDSRGNRTLYERTGSSIYKKTSQYNANNDLILESGFNGSENFRNEFHYDGTKIASAKYTQGGTTTQEIKYTHSGNTATAKVYTQGTTHSATLVMKYDNKGNLLEEITQSPDGRELEKKTYTYDSNSNLTEETKNQGGEFDYRIIYTYTAKGYPKEVAEETRVKEKHTKKLYTYDSQENLIKFEWRRNPDEEFNRKTYTYDTRGICLSEETCYPKTKFMRLAKFEYTYY